MNRLPTNPGRSRIVQVMTPTDILVQALSRVLIDPDQPDAANPIMLAPRPTSSGTSAAKG